MQCQVRTPSQCSLDTFENSCERHFQASLYCDLLPHSPAPERHRRQAAALYLQSLQQRLLRMLHSSDAQQGATGSAEILLSDLKQGISNVGTSRCYRSSQHAKGSSSVCGACWELQTACMYDLWTRGFQNDFCDGVLLLRRDSPQPQRGSTAGVSRLRPWLTP